MEANATTCEPLVQPSKDGDEPLTQTGPHPLQYSNVDSTLWMKLYGPSRPCGQDGGPPVLWSSARSSLRRLRPSSIHWFHTRITVIAACPKRAEMSRNELQQAPVVEQIERKQLNWFGHLVRMGDERKVKEVFESRVEGKRRRGRPRIEWEQYVNDMVRRRGKEIRKIRRLALDRERYKKWVEDPTLQGIRDR
ncbi:hypothetical protein ANN_07893 [Periplaneta americana]|uniref:Uncharacterized protein n=1 Tax=Periplaneta americana TaxID=6978 RepID=A0ABQ8SZW1_PERAM|nr:hypothetical protein ANN_07893 [Periplaneta americana]